MSGVIFAAAATASAALLEFKFFLPVALTKTIPNSQEVAAEFFETSFAHLAAIGIFELKPFTFLWDSGETPRSVCHIVETPGGLRRYQIYRESCGGKN
jgi:hypothetical protein